MIASSLTVAALLAAAAPVATPAKRLIVVCAPGYPGNTVQAQSTMNSFASAVEASAGWPAGRLGAEYQETERGGLERMTAAEAGLAIVPLPFLLEHGATLGLKPILQIETESGPTDEWSLVARKSALPSAGALAGWEITGMPGYSRAFVAGTILGSWGKVPPTATITFSAGILSSLRRASAGEKVAVLVDKAGASSLGSLPFGKELEIVTRSKPLPSTFLCTIGDRMSGADATRLIDTLTTMHRQSAAAPVLATMKIKRVVPIDSKALDAARASFRAASAPPSARS